MFGLMKVPSCMGKEFIDNSKLHYCGVCKSIASKYSQKSRLFLNNDTVFLAEILSALTQKNTFDWNKLYSVKKCLVLPSNNMPLELQFAGATNVFLSELKFNDNFFDSGKIKCFWLAIKKLFNSDFKKATKNLSAWGVNILDFYKLCDEQNKREKQKIVFEVPTLALDYFSEKSSEMTAIIFKTSAKVINKDSESEKMYQLGYHFGKIVYLLDALTDWKADYKKNNFNAIQMSYNYNEKELSSEIREKVVLHINNSYEIIKTQINNLDLNAKMKEFFIKRLEHNIKNQTTLKTCSTKKKNGLFAINLNKKEKKNNQRKTNSSPQWYSNCEFCELCQCCECLDCCGSCSECGEGCAGCAECGSCS